jgi:hypothetical protein
MKHCFYLFFALLLVLGCRRTTEVSGIIANLRNNRPIVGASIKLKVFNGYERDSSDPKLVKEVKTVSDANGEYSLEYEDKGIDDVDLEIAEGVGQGSDYFSIIYIGSLRANCYNNVNIYVDSAAATLNLTFVNPTSTLKSVFYEVNCDATGPPGHYFCSGGQIEKKIGANAQVTVKQKVSGGRVVDVHWGTAAFPSFKGPNIDTIFCPLWKTTAHTIRL